KGERVLTCLHGQVSTFADEQGPRPADTIAIERTPVRILAIAVLVVTMVDTAGRRLHLQHAIDDHERVHDARIPGAAQPEPHEVGKIHAHERASENRLAGPIAQPDLPGQLARLVDRGDAHVVAADAQSAGLWGIAYITPTLQALVPVIRQCIDILPFLVREPGGRRDQRADGHCQREWTDAGVFLPAILIAGRSRTHDE